MKQGFGIITTIVLAFFLLLNGNVNAQDKNHVYTISTWKMTIPQDGSNKELNQLFKDWYENITMKNDKIISEKILRHRSGSDGRDWLVITEYANWNDINEADKIQNKLVKETWPKLKDRQAYFKLFRKYTVHHSDEIMTELLNLRK